MVKDFIKKILPKSALKKIRPSWHGFLAYAAAFRFGFPSENLILIGVTGTAGKSTTVQMIARILNHSGKKAGYTTTAGYSVDGKNDLRNELSLSMPGGPVLQKMLSEMIDAGCKYAVVEATSEGLAQNRQKGINFDLALLTNLHPAHLDTHGGFEEYRKAKGKLFKSLASSKYKTIFPEKIIGLNLGSQDVEYFGQFKSDRKFGVISGLSENEIATGIRSKVDTIFAVENLHAEAEGSEFEIAGQKFALKIPGEFNAWNAAMATATARILGASLKECAEALSDFHIPGRMEEINSEKRFKVIIDYAPEPIDLENSLYTANQMRHSRLVHVFGSTGGHRDAGKRQEFGKISAAYADKIIITNDDVYESDPEKIAEDIKEGVSMISAVKPLEVLIILDRKEAISSAIKNAQPGDIILITGKGSENFLVLPGNKKIDWDEKKIVEECIKNN